MKQGWPLSNRGRWLLAAGILAAAVIADVGLQALWWPAAHPIDVQLTDIAGLTIQPIPEGPTLIWNHPRTGPYSDQQQQIEAAIPLPLPAPEIQTPGCGGGNLIVHLRDGRDITYGPCRHPASIRALWSRLIMVLGDPNCRQPCAPTE